MTDERTRRRRVLRTLSVFVAIGGLLTLALSPALGRQTVALAVVPKHAAPVVSGFVPNFAALGDDVDVEEDVQGEDESGSTDGSDTPKAGTDQDETEADENDQDEADENDQDEADENDQDEADENDQDDADENDQDDADEAGEDDGDQDEADEDDGDQDEADEDDADDADDADDGDVDDANEPEEGTDD